MDSQLQLEKTWISPWGRTCALLGLLLLVLVSAYWTTARGFVAMWRTSTFSHGFLIVPISMYLIWMRRNRLQNLKPTPKVWALPVIALFGFGWLLAHIAAASVVEQFCFIGIVIACIWGMVGTVAAREMALPLSFLVFAVPAGESVIPKLQDFSAWFAVKLLDFFGVPVLLQGRFISVPSGQWEVAEACSGIRYLTSSVAVGFLFAGLVYRSWTRRLGFFLASVGVPILANAVRVFGIVFLAYKSGNRIAVGVDHLLYGWLFFTIVMILLFAVGGRWRESARESNLRGTVKAAEAASPSENSGAIGASAVRSVIFASFLLVMAVLAPISMRIIWRAPNDAGERAPLLPPAISPPLGSRSGLAYGWKPILLSPSSELMQGYEMQTRIVELYVAYYAASQQDAKVVSSGNAVFDRKKWQRSGERELAATFDNQRLIVHETSIQSAERSLVVWSWYWIGGKSTSSGAMAKLLLAKARFMRDSRGAAIIMIATEDLPNQQPPAEILQDFLNHVSLAETLRAGMAR